MTTTENWATTLKKAGYEFVPDDLALQGIANMYSLDKADIAKPGFRESLERALEQAWRASTCSPR